MRQPGFSRQYFAIFSDANILKNKRIKRYHIKGIDIFNQETET